MDRSGGGNRSKVVATSAPHAPRRLSGYGNNEVAINCRDRFRGKMRKRYSVALLAAIGLLLLGGCAQAGPTQLPPTPSPEEGVGKWGEVTVFAASSLQDAF